MSRRERTIKSVASGLQPKSYDLTSHARARAASRVRDPMKLRAEDAAGALAFAANDRIVDGEELAGTPLSVLLLRLKYADQFSKVLFARAHRILLDRYGGLATKKSETMEAVAFIALFEWAHDECSSCRGRRQGVAPPRPCPACPTYRRAEMELGREERDRQGRRLTNDAARIGPAPGCPKCKGRGRTFRADRKPRGSRCVTCRNTGRLELKRKVRFVMVSGHLGDLQETSGRRREGIDYQSFRVHWLPRYERFIEVLRATDRNLAEGVDLGLFASHNRGTPIQEEHLIEPDVSGFDTPQEPSGELPPE